MLGEQSGTRSAGSCESVKALQGVVAVVLVVNPCVALICGTQVVVASRGAWLQRVMYALALSTL